MKRFFHNLKTLAMVAMVGVATLATSCNQDELDQIKTDLSDLTQRVEDLENKLNDEIAALKTLIDNANGSIEALEEGMVVADCEQDENGNWILTLADGTELNVSKVGQSNLTVVVEGDNYYWATVVNGVVSAVVDENGNKVPVMENEAQVRQNDNGQTEVSLDGGYSWITMQGLGLFEDVVLANGVVTFTLADGQTFTVELPKPFAYNVAGNLAYFKNEEVKVVGIEVEGITDTTILTIPAGWDVVLGEDALTVTAPSQAAVEAGEAVGEGVIKVLATTADNKCVIGKLYVEIGQGITLAIETREFSYRDWNVGGMVSGVGPCLVIRNPYYLGIDDYGDKKYKPYNVGIYLAGDMKLSEVNDMSINYNYDYGYDFVNDSGYPYEDDPSVNITDDMVYECSIPVQKLVSDCLPQNPETWEPAQMQQNTAYTFWVQSYEIIEWESVASEADIITLDWISYDLSVEHVATTFNDVQIKAAVGGCESYWVYVTDGDWKKQFDTWKGSDWETFGVLRTDATFEGSIFDFSYDPNDYWAGKELAMPGTTYTLAILPVLEGKATADYKYKDVITYTYTTLPAGEGSTVVPTLTPSCEMSKVTVDVAVENAYCTFYTFYAPDEYAKLATPEAVVADLKVNGGRTGEGEFYSTNYSMKPGEDVYFAVLVLDKEGKYNELVVEKYTSKDVVFNDDLKVTIGEISNNFAGDEVYIPVTVEGGECNYFKYAYVPESTWNGQYGGNLETAEKVLAADEWADTAYSYDLDEQGRIVQRWVTADVKAYIIVLAIDGNGATSHGAYAVYTPVASTLDWIRATEENYEYGKPTITYKGIDDTGLVSYDITFAENTKQVWVTPYNSGYDNGWAAYDFLFEVVVNEWMYTESFTENGVYTIYGTNVYNAYSSDFAMLCAWLDDNDKYHQVWFNYEAAEAAQEDVIRVCLSETE